MRNLITGRMLLLACFVLAAVSAIRCIDGLYFRRSPKLKLLLSDDRNSALDPTWTPDGKAIYYLNTSAQMYIRYSGGSLWKIAADGSQNREVLDGNFGALAVSPDGSRLALTCGSFVYGGRAIVVDTDGTVVDSLPEIARHIADLEFSEDGRTLFCYHDSSGLFCRIHLDSRQIDTILQLPYPFNGGFNVVDDSLLLYFDGVFDMRGGETSEVQFGWHPESNPVDPKLVVSATDALNYEYWSRRLSIVDLEAGSSRVPDASPYRSPAFDYPSWSPDGTQLLFSAASMQYYGRPRPFELWILTE